jgi:hypothetical protein
VDTIGTAVDGIVQIVPSTDRTFTFQAIASGKVLAQAFAKDGHVIKRMMIVVEGTPGGYSAGRQGTLSAISAPTSGAVIAPTRTRRRLRCRYQNRSSAMEARASTKPILKSVVSFAPRCGAGCPRDRESA